MTPEERLLKLGHEALKIRARYNPQTTEDLEKIAVEEFGVSKVVHTFLTRSKAILTKKKQFYIFYHADFKPCLPLMLGHEIGHIAAGHFHAAVAEKVREKEANYFSACLNGFAPSVYQKRFDREAVENMLSFFSRPSKEKRMQEIRRLQELGVYDILQRSDTILP